MTAPLRYLSAYSPELQQQARELLSGGRLAPWLLARHPQAHGKRNDGALYAHVEALRQAHMRQTPRLDRVCFDSKLHVVQHALGLHTRVSRVQGNKLKAAREIRVAAVFRDAPLPFLDMIAVHELAHLREREHDRAFYRLCTHMLPDYHQLELELRLYLTHLEAGGERLWAAPSVD
ncbi:YgjP-like metallopeptidase domain-containing protein [Hydrogenophaga sp. OTU3427]|uniref:YgjP-like metallopeptidase domain-containing protein n=1 Tax=Hydrogenophaga sp. OTU3427 TaxID=3043856 RepID=UPI00313D10B4